MVAPASGGDAGDGVQGEGAVVGFLGQGAVQCQGLDESVQLAGGGGVEMLLQVRAAASRPFLGEFPVGGSAGGDGVELLGEDEVALAPLGQCVDEVGHRGPGLVAVDRAGFPTATTFAGTSLVTTAPAPMTQLSPMAMAATSSAVGL
ncbi:hypothetical protein AQI70_36110 [Streptomyces curacoi]|uniref:Uncharacterized protein n=1 Tax=Streptomyces curacoi TaxID=146536 RepID=A0A124GU36_9ACTN|nr:hypothetical protein AQI70_36110 [Streptomyces curacoi]